MLPKLQLRTQARITPHLVLANHILRLPVGEIEALIQRELAENPALELDEDQYSRAKGWGQACQPYLDERDVIVEKSAIHATDEGRIESLVSRDSAMDLLIAQIRLMVGEDDLDIAIYLIQSLDA